MGKEIVDDIFMMGIGNDTYQQLLEIAKKEGKSVTDVTSEALKKHVAEKSQVQESKTQPRMLMEG